MDIRSLLGKQLLFFDGGMGSLLQEKGLQPGALPELMNLTDPQTIRQIHTQYYQAGSHVVTANTFGANRLKLRGSGHSAEEVVSAAVANARAAAEQCGGDAPRFVALDIGPTGKLLAPMGELPFEEAVDAFAEVARAGERAGADLAIIETMTDTYEAKAAVLAVKEHTTLPVFLTFSFDAQGKLLTGGSIAAAVAIAEGLRVDALGFNCGLGPVQMKGLLPQLLEATSTPIILNPNAGMPAMRDGKTVYDVLPDEFAREMEQMAQMGACVLGGCCGTTPAYIREMVARCKPLSPVPVARKGKTVVSSYAEVREIGAAPIIIGERINPTGKKRFQQALRENDMDYVLTQAVEQQASGAHILDVNVGLPGIDERAVMGRAVEALQCVTALPLQIDTSDPVVMEHALRLYNGKAMMNSVSGKQEVMDQVFPLAQKYGGVIVALTLDESGIPATAEGRLQIARRIVSEAEKYGIEKKDIVIDALTMTISSDAQAAHTTLEAVRLIKRELGVKTVLGVSNVSFGLPNREVINAAFYTMALQAGLDAGIINPNMASMRGAYLSYCALAGLDPQCGAYISHFAGGEEQAAKGKELSLYEILLRGLKDQAYESTKALLQNRDSNEIINQILVPALNEVGQGFEKKTVFLPQLMSSAAAATNAFEAIKEHVLASGAAPEKHGTILLATVEGDIHDIGKNIVKVMLDNYGFDVIDLGKNVPCERVVDEAERLDCRLVGLSALMTTTVPAMERTIRLLRERGLDCRVMVGGAVLTQEYADEIGADFYGKDAMASVRFAQQLFSV